MHSDNNERISRALDWCKERNIGSKQLNLFEREHKKREERKDKKMFNDLDIKVVKTIRRRLKAELRDKGLPYHRREEVNAILYNIDVVIKERARGSETLR